MATALTLAVRDLRLDEVGFRIDYFHGSTDEHLRRLGVDREKLPAPDAWRASYEEDYRRPVEHRETWAVAWEVDDELVGFSSVDHISFGSQAFLHLQMVRPERRNAGLGAELVRLSAARFFQILSLERLFSEPNAFNVAPNRTLQRAGFRYLFTHETTPGPLNFPQVATRWVLDRADLKAGAGD